VNHQQIRSYALALVHQSRGSYGACMSRYSAGKSRLGIREMANAALGAGCVACEVRGASPQSVLRHPARRH